MCPRTAIQFKEIRDKSKTKILEAALELFAVYGYGQTSMSQIAKKANISKGLIYNYFESKEELLETIVFNACDQADDILQEGLSRSDPHDRLRAFIESFFDSLQHDITYWRFLNAIFLQAHLVENIRNRLSERTLQFLSSVEELFRAIGVAHPTIEARLFVAILDGIGLHYFLNYENYQLSKLKENLIDKYCKP